MRNEKFIPALGYDVLTQFYDFTIKLTMPEKKFRNKLIDYVSPKSGEQILEFGFGTAQNIIVLLSREKGAIIKGIDVDQKVLKIAQYKLTKNGLEIPLSLYSGSTLPFADNSFDKVFSSLVFHQLDKETKENSLKELYRILKPTGKLIIGDWGEAKNKLMRLSFYIVQMLDGFKTTNDNVNGLMIDYIIDAGFQKVEEKDYINTALGTYSYYTGIK